MLRVEGSSKVQGLRYGQNHAIPYIFRKLREFAGLSITQHVSLTKDTLLQTSTEPETCRLKHLPRFSATDGR